MIKDDIQKAILTNLKAGKATEVKVLRFILSELKYAEINSGRELTDAETINVLSKELKKRKEAIEMFRKGGRNDLVEDEESQLSVIESYLPEQLSNEEIKKIVDAEVAAAGPNPQMGKVIGAVMAETKGRADGGLVAKLVREKLQPVS